jgi:CRISPR-associated protein (TIGR02584 family)
MNRTCPRLNPAHPESYPRRVLLAVTGLSPQVVTETLYHLACCRTAPFVPTEVYVLTTGKGAETAMHSLFGEEKNQFRRFCEDYGLTGQIRFAPFHVEAMKNARGVLLHDIITEEDSAAAGDAIINWIRRHTQDDDSAVHVSIAGGRKTMSFYAGYALSLFGREQDRLSHVLVSQPFESTEEFYFPPIRPRQIKLRNGDLVDTGEARVMLAEIPLLRLRRRIPEPLLTEESSFARLVDAAQSAFGAARLAIVFSRCSLECGGVAVELQPQFLVFYAWLAWRRRQGPGTGEIHGSEVRAADVEAYRAIYRKLANAMEESPEPRRRRGVPARLRLENGDARKRQKFFEEACCRINKALEESLGDAWEYYGIAITDKSPKRGADGQMYTHHRLVKYFVALPPEQIDWEELPE